MADAIILTCFYTFATLTTSEYPLRQEALVYYANHNVRADLEARYDAQTERPTVTQIAFRLSGHLAQSVAIRIPKSR